MEYLIHQIPIAIILSHIFTQPSKIKLLSRHLFFIVLFAFDPIGTNIAAIMNLIHDYVIVTTPWLIGVFSSYFQMYFTSKVRKRIINLRKLVGYYFGNFNCLYAS